MPASLPHGARFDLTHYLLGLLPEEQTDQLDELSVVDDGFAGQLCVAETELVDAYLRGALPGDLRVRFESQYLGSPRRRAHIAFAERFLGAVDAAVSRTTSRIGSSLGLTGEQQLILCASKENYMRDLSR